MPASAYYDVLENGAVFLSVGKEPYTKYDFIVAPTYKSSSFMPEPDKGLQPCKGLVLRRVWLVETLAFAARRVLGP